MATTSNSTLKGVLAFGALTIGAVMFFVGSEDSEGVLSVTANNAGDQAEEAGNIAPASRSTAKPQEQPADSANIVEWDDEALIDSTNGFDPEPESPDPFSDGPTDDTINESDGGRDNLELSESDIPQPGAVVPIPSTADRPEN